MSCILLLDSGHCEYYVVESLDFVFLKSLILFWLIVKLLVDDMVMMMMMMLFEA